MKTYDIEVLVLDETDKVISTLNYSVTADNELNAKVEALNQARRNISMREGEATLKCILESSNVIIDNNEIDFNHLGTYMDDELREELHTELSPCRKQEFIDKYVEQAFERDPGFINLLNAVFNCDLEQAPKTQTR